MHWLVLRQENTVRVDRVCSLEPDQLSPTLPALTRGEEECKSVNRKSPRAASVCFHKGARAELQQRIPGVINPAIAEKGLGRTLFGE